MLMIKTMPTMMTNNRDDGEDDDKYEDYHDHHHDDTLQGGKLFMRVEALSMRACM